MMQSDEFIVNCTPKQWKDYRKKMLQIKPKEVHKLDELYQATNKFVNKIIERHPVDDLIKMELDCTDYSYKPTEDHIKHCRKDHTNQLYALIISGFVNWSRKGDINADPLDFPQESYNETKTKSDFVKNLQLIRDSKNREDFTSAFHEYCSLVIFQFSPDELYDAYVGIFGNSLDFANFVFNIWTKTMINGNECCKNVGSTLMDSDDVDLITTTTYRHFVDYHSIELTNLQKKNDISISEKDGKLSAVVSRMTQYSLLPSMIKCKTCRYMRKSEGLYDHTKKEHPEQISMLLKLMYFGNIFDLIPKEYVNESKGKTIIEKMKLLEDFVKKDLLKYRSIYRSDISQLDFIDLDDAYNAEYEIFQDKQTNKEMFKYVVLICKLLKNDCCETKHDENQDHGVFNKQFWDHISSEHEEYVQSFLKNNNLTVSEKTTGDAVYMQVSNTKDVTKQIYPETQEIEEEGYIGTRVIIPEKKKTKWREYVKSKQYAQQNNCHSSTDWMNLTKTSDFPDDIPVNVALVYKIDWKGWGDFLGCEKLVKRAPLTKENINKILKLLHDRWDFYGMYTDGMMTDWFITQGLFNIKDPIMNKFFTEFISWRHLPEGIAAIKSWLETGDFTKEYGAFSLKSQKVEETVEQYLDRQASNPDFYKAKSLVDDDDPMGIEKIMLEAREITPTIEDKRWFDAQVDFVVKKIWEKLFDNEHKELKLLAKLKPVDRVFHDAILKKVKDQHKEVREVNYDKEYYTFQHEPTLFQLYSAWYIRQKNGYLNMGSTGSGKSGAALIATKATKSKHVLIICPNNIKDKWVADVNKRFYAGSQYVKEGPVLAPGFFVDSGIHHTKYHIVNYDKFSTKGAKNLVNQLLSANVDFVILDEGQLIKKTDSEEDSESLRRKTITNLIYKIREKNRKLKVMVLSATPVINNVREGVSLLNVVTGTQYNIPTHNNMRNASRLYTEFQPFSVVYTQKNNIVKKGHDTPIICDYELDEKMTDEELVAMKWVDLEYLATQSRLPKIIETIKNSNGKVVIYTDYVKYDENRNPHIVNLMRNAIEKEGYKVGLFIGDDKTGLIRNTGTFDKDGNAETYNPFVEGRYDVIIASRPFAVGLDGVQLVCNNLIFNGLVWTWAEFEQIIGRLARTGQVENHVNIHLMMTRFCKNIDGEMRYADYDLKLKYNRLLYKKAIGDCVRFGTLPNKLYGDLKSEKMKILNNILRTKKSDMPTKKVVRLQRDIETLEWQIGAFMDSVEKQNDRK